jgi:hypothetical protein
MNCPTSLKALYMGVAADCSYVATYGSAEEARYQILKNWNIINAIYESTFNIFLGIIDMRLMTTCQNTSFNRPCSVPTGGVKERLMQFSEWRGTLSPSSDGGSAGLWHLVGNTLTSIIWTYQINDVVIN